MLLLIKVGFLLLWIVQSIDGFRTALFQITPSSFSISSSLAVASRGYEDYGDYYDPVISEGYYDDVFYGTQKKVDYDYNQRRINRNHRGMRESDYRSPREEDYLYPTFRENIDDRRSYDRNSDYSPSRSSVRRRRRNNEFDSIRDGELLPEPRRYADNNNDLPPLRTRRPKAPGRRILRNKRSSRSSTTRREFSNYGEGNTQPNRRIKTRREPISSAIASRPQRKRKLLHRSAHYQIMDYAERGNVEGLARVLESSAVNPNFVDEDGDTPLLRAASNGHAAAVSFLLDRGASANHHTEPGETPLYWASCNGHGEVVRILLQKGRADPRIVDCEGKTPLHWAAYHGHEQVCNWLMQRYHGMNHATVDPNLADSYSKKSAMQIARERGHLGCVQLMESCMMQHKQRREYEARLVEYAAIGRGADVQQLLEGGIPANITNEFGQVPLYVASCNGHSDIVQWLLHYGADPNLASGKDGHTPLYAASWNGHAQVAQQLLDRGADPNVRCGERGETPLYAASTNGQNRVIQILLSRGADPYFPNGDGETPFDAASREGLKLLKQVYYKGSSSSTIRRNYSQAPRRLPANQNRRLINQSKRQRPKRSRRPPVLSSADRRTRF